MSLRARRRYYYIVGCENGDDDVGGGAPPVISGAKLPRPGNSIPEVLIHNVEYFIIIYPSPRLGLPELFACFTAKCKCCRKILFSSGKVTYLPSPYHNLAATSAIHTLWKIKISNVSYITILYMPSVRFMSTR